MAKVWCKPTGQAYTKRMMMMMMMINIEIMIQTDQAFR